MYLRLRPDRPVELREPHDFTAFKVVRTEGVVDADLDAVGRRDGEHVFVDRSLLIAAGPDDPTWVADLDAMIGSVRRFGWVDDAGAVRAHVE